MEGFRGFTQMSGAILEVAGIATILLAALFTTATALWRLRRQGKDSSYRAYRTSLGRGILLGLEFLVAGDIVRTVVIEPTLQSVLVLGIIVLIRTFLSFTLEVEMTGRWPWNRSGAS